MRGESLRRTACLFSQVQPLNAETDQSGLLKLAPAGH